MNALDTQTVTPRRRKTRGARLGAIAAWLALAGCAAAPSAHLPVGPTVSVAEEQGALAVFRDRASRFRQAADQRVQGIIARLQAAMDLTEPVPFQLLDSNEVNAYARGGVLYVTLAMVRFVNTDDELALVVGHEIGHLLAARHPDAERLSFDERERVADYHALVGLHRAGYDLMGACEIWQRMATELPAQSEHGQASRDGRGPASHPSFAERYVRAHKLHNSFLAGNPPPAAPPAATAGAPSPSATTHSLR